MSAFMCRPETIWNVACWLYKYRDEYLGECLEYPEDIYEHLVEMNKKAIMLRYPDKAEEMIGDMTEYKNYVIVNNLLLDQSDARRVNIGIELYTSIRCFRYQCCEGDIPDSDLYKEVEESFVCVMHEIIGMMAQAAGIDPLNYWG